MTCGRSGGGPGSPFDLTDSAAYEAWRARKLARRPATADDLLVRVGDIAAPTETERQALLHRLRCCGMALYAETPRFGRDDRAALRHFAARFGLRRLDRNPLADDGVTPLAVHREGARARYIPYTERPIAWHTDGYYNPSGDVVRAVLLHCVRPAAAGGANRLADHEALYILLRDEDPAHVAALMRPDAMTIPGNEEEGLRRPAVTGPVFFVDPEGALRMRYTARLRNVIWCEQPGMQAAVTAIHRLLEEPGRHVLTHRLKAGQGLICSNVLHTREPFRDSAASPRLLYRLRYLDRIDAAAQRRGESEALAAMPDG